MTRKTKEKSKKGFDSKKEAQLAAEEMEGDSRMLRNNT
ncbi:MULTISPECIES: Arm DNA-binding domain-containing protein [Peribacillus]